MLLGYVVVWATMTRVGPDPAVQLYPTRAVCEAVIAEQMATFAEVVAILGPQLTEGLREEAWCERVERAQWIEQPGGTWMRVQWPRSPPLASRNRSR
jgi:hypothetical protein